MSEDIYAKPDMSNKVRYNRNVQKDNEWEEREVEIYDDIGDDQTANQSHGGGPDTERNPPAVQRKTLRAAALCLAVLCFLMMTGIILSAYLSVNMSQLKEEVKQLKNRTEEISVNSQLESSYQTLSKNNSQLQDEVKKLKKRIKDEKSLKTENSCILPINIIWLDCVCLMLMNLKYFRDSHLRYKNLRETIYKLFTE
ncbi:uncharacterized protein LOC120572048 isoform X4 [Perca fluviatilis]|uniref:uncharacterized protein LOC120572048 isoform X4 n=1 Tax=Perca fluviatilis TaxID=8168 RepID=UPI001965BD6A|nr:uncharacterized protein LOC120572048 isoform X4 [Perca fluviatilis]